MAGNVVMAALQKPVLAVAARRSRAPMLLAALPFYFVAFGALSLGRASWGAGVIVLVLVAAMLGGVAEVTVNALMLGAANDAAPPGRQGRYSALFQTSWGLAEAVAPTIFAVLLARGNPVLWLTLAGSTLLIVPLLLTVRRRLPERALLAAPEG